MNVQGIKAEFKRLDVTRERFPSFEDLKREHIIKKSYLISLMEELLETECESSNIVKEIIFRYRYTKDCEFPENDCSCDSSVYFESQCFEDINNAEFFVPFNTFHSKNTELALLLDDDIKFSMVLVTYGFDILIPSTEEQCHSSFALTFLLLGLTGAFLRLFGINHHIKMDVDATDDYYLPEIVRPKLHTLLDSEWCKLKRLWLFIWVLYVIKSTYFEGNKKVKAKESARRLEFFFKTVPDPFLSRKEFEEILSFVINPLTLKDKSWNLFLPECLERYEVLFSWGFQTGGPRSLKHLCRVWIRDCKKSITLPKFVNCLELPQSLKYYVLGY